MELFVCHRIARAQHSAPSTEEKSEEKSPCEFACLALELRSRELTAPPLSTLSTHPVLYQLGVAWSFRASSSRNPFVLGAPHRTSQRNCKQAPPVHEDASYVRKPLLESKTERYTPPLSTCSSTHTFDKIRAKLSFPWPVGSRSLILELKPQFQGPVRMHQFRCHFRGWNKGFQRVDTVRRWVRMAVSFELSARQTLSDYLRNRRWPFKRLKSSDLLTAAEICIRTGPDSSVVIGSPLELCM